MANKRNERIKESIKFISGNAVCLRHLAIIFDAEDEKPKKFAKFIEKYFKGISKQVTDFRINDELGLEDEYYEMEKSYSRKKKKEKDPKDIRDFVNKHVNNDDCRDSRYDRGAKSPSTSEMMESYDEFLGFKNF